MTDKVDNVSRTTWRGKAKRKVEPEMMSDELFDALVMGDEVKVNLPDGDEWTGFVRGYLRNGKIYFQKHVVDWLKVNYPTPDAYHDFLKNCTVEDAEAYDDGYPK